MKLIFFILGCSCIVGAVVAYLFLDIQQKAFTQRVRLHDKASVVCQETELKAIVDDPDFAPGLYSFIADFKIVEDLCSKNILTEAMCGKCINMHQEVAQWQERTETRTVCSRMGRNGQLVTEKYDHDDESDEAKEARENVGKDSRNQNCREVTETRQDWRHHEDGSQAWDFAHSDHYENGYWNLQFTALDDDSKYVNFLGHGPHQEIIRQNALNKLNFHEDMGIWSFASNAPEPTSNQLCINHDEARDHFPADGLTNAEFQALPNYGSADHYDESCIDPGLGDYKVRAQCHGTEDSDIRIIANLDWAGTNLTSGGWTDASFPDIEHAIFKMFVFIWEQDSTKSTEQTFADFTQHMFDEMQALKTGIYTLMVFLVLGGLFLLGLSGNKKKSKSSSSS